MSRSPDCGTMSARPLSEGPTDSAYVSPALRTTVSGPGALLAAMTAPRIVVAWNIAGPPEMTPGPSSVPVTMYVAAASGPGRQTTQAAAAFAITICFHFSFRWTPGAIPVPSCSSFSVS